jgi:uncharacterized protein YgiM (DUF1202 family)
MRKVKILVFIIIMIIEFNAIYAHELSGVWFVEKRENMKAGDGFGSGTWFYQETVSWGNATVHRGALLIDCEVRPGMTISFLHDENWAYIMSLEKENDNTYLMTVSDTNGRDKIEKYRFTMLSRNSMRISALDPNKDTLLCWTGSNYILYKNDAPPANYVFSATHYTTDNLRLRYQPDLSGGIITTLPKNTGVKILQTQREVIIDDIKGDWVRVVSENGYMGFCFSGYLRE